MIIRTTSERSEHTELSTFSTASTTPIKPTEKPALQRRVRFRETRNQYFENPRCASECSQSWLTSADYLKFRANRHASAKHQEHATALLEFLFQAADHVNFELNDASCLMKTSNVAPKLAQLYTQESTSKLRGMESCLLKMSTDRTQRCRSALQGMVYEIQCDYDEGYLTLEQMEQALATCSRKASQACVLFAQFLAQAPVQA